MTVTRYWLFRRTDTFWWNDSSKSSRLEKGLTCRLPWSSMDNVVNQVSTLLKGTGRVSKYLGGEYVHNGHRYQGTIHLRLLISNKIYA